MAELSTDLLEIVLRDVAATGNEPWYPSAYAQVTGVPRERLDACLDRLRLAGLVRLTDWVQGRGQGYSLTEEGGQVLNNPRLLERLRAGRELPRQTQPQQAEPRSLRQPATAWDRGEAIRTALLDRSPAAVTRGLIWANVAVFALGLWMAMQANLFNEYLGFSGRGVNVIRHDIGGLAPVDLQLGQWWRLVSYAFVHGGILHLAMNMYALYVLGSFVEKMWGPVRFLIMYLIAAVGGAALQMWSAPDIGMVGASGAICGLLGSMAAWTMLNRVYLPPQLVSNLMRNLMLNGLLIAFISMVPGISWAGHLGGALAGAVVSVPLNYTRFGNGVERVLGWVGVAAIPVLCVFVAIWSVGGNEAPVTLPANNAAVLQAREKYNHVFRDADKIATNVYNQFAGPLLHGQVNLKDAPATAEQYAIRFDQTAKQLKDLAAQFDGAEEFGSRGITQHVAAARKYVESAENFYRTFAEYLRPPDNWGRQRRDNLLAEYDYTLELHRRIRDSVLFRPELE